MATDHYKTTSHSPDKEGGTAADSTGDSPSAPLSEEQSATDGEGGADTPHPAFERYAAEAVPAAAVGSAGKDGLLELRFATDADGETALVRDLARAPFHVSGTLGHDPHPDAETVYVQSPTGGVAQGDRRAISVTVDEGALAHISTGSSTKVLSMSRNYGAVDVSLSVGPDAHLDYVPAPTILHADARYYEGRSLDVAPSGSAIVGEVVVPGRLARGERFAFERYCSRFEACSDSALLATDAAHLAPDERDPTAAGVLGEFAVLGTLYIVAPAADAAELSDRLHDAVARGPGAETNGDSGQVPAAGDGDDAGDGERGHVRAGATALPNDAGVVVRAVGHRAESVTAAVRAAWDEARTALVGVGAPDPRRQ
jgi:urease accessory protein